MGHEMLHSSSGIAHALARPTALAPAANDGGQMFGGTSARRDRSAPPRAGIALLPPTVLPHPAAATLTSNAHTMLPAREPRNCSKNARPSHNLLSAHPGTTKRELSRPLSGQLYSSAKAPGSLCGMLGSIGGLNIGKIGHLTPSLAQQHEQYNSVASATFQLPVPASRAGACTPVAGGELRSVTPSRQVGALLDPRFTSHKPCAMLGFPSSPSMMSTPPGGRPCLNSPTRGVGSSQTLTQMWPHAPPLQGSPNHPIPGSFLDHSVPVNTTGHVPPETFADSLSKTLLMGGQCKRRAATPEPMHGERHSLQGLQLLSRSNHGLMGAIGEAPASGSSGQMQNILPPASLCKGVECGKSSNISSTSTLHATIE